MHDTVRAFVGQAVAGRTFERVVEVGSVDINGTIRDLVTAENYIGVDIVDGPGVDLVVDATEWSPPQPVDLVVCCEVFEHTEHWPQILSNAAMWLAENGTLVVTCATDPRWPHPADGSQRLHDGEYYRNVAPGDLQAAAELCGLEVLHLSARNGDLHMIARAGSSVGNMDPDKEAHPPVDVEPEDDGVDCEIPVDLVEAHEALAFAEAVVAAAEKTDG